MSINLNTKFFISILLPAFVVASCNKQWLESKPESKLSTIDKLQDYSLLLDGNINSTPNYGTIGSDEYYIPQGWLNDIVNYFGIQNVEMYTWAPNGFSNTYDNNWEIPYSTIFRCNLIINNIEKYKSQDPDLYQRTLGAAYFWRGLNYFELALYYSLPYDSASASQTLGVPIRLVEDITLEADRESLQKVYDQAVSDLSNSISRLPDSVQNFKIRPNKAAAYSVLSRLYLSARNYPLALKYADSALQYNSNLLDFNSITAAPEATVSMPLFKINPEVNYITSTYEVFISSYFVRMDSVLYDSYHSDDLRKTHYFLEQEPNTYYFKGTYDGRYNDFIFSAAAVDELYLVKAECLVRLDQVAEGLDYLNMLLEKRWVAGTYIPATNLNKNDALRLVITERKKELIFRSTNWLDMKRFSMEPAFAKTFRRYFNNQEFLLEPGSLLYAWPIPKHEILNSGIAQNSRN